MSEMIWILYFADVLNALQGLAALASLFSGALTMWWFCAKYELDFDNVRSWWVLASASVCVFTALFAALTPSKTTIYAYAGAKAIESQLEQANINGTIQNDIYLLIRKKIKDELQGAEGGDQ